MKGNITAHRWRIGLLVGCLALLASTSLLSAQDAPAVETAPVAEDAATSIPIPAIWWVAPIGALIALIGAWVMYKQVRDAPEGDERMKEIAGHVREGAMAYLKRQYKVVAVFFLVVCIALFLMGLAGLQHKIVFFAFLTGGFFSGLCGFLGMRTATLASNRTTQGAKESLNRGLQVAFRAGAVMGLVVVGFGLLDITAWFLILSKVAPRLIEGFHMSLTEITVVMLCFGMGASSQALFARVGGGIYTKAADVGADLVGKVEAGIPEDDPRNPATIADNVGDNVGDVAGMGADLYESYCGSILATAALGVAAAMRLGLDKTNDYTNAMKLLAAPMVLAGVGILLSIVGIYLVRTRENATMKQLMGALNRGVFGSSLFIIIAAFVICRILLGGIDGINYYGIWGSITVGMLAGIAIGKATEYSTSYDYRPTKNVAENAETGPATVIIAGIAEGMKSTWMSLATVIVAIMLAFSFAGGFHTMLLGLYGVGMAAVSMLATLGITLATDAYGPIADNAGGNAEMTGQQPQVRERTDALDSLGNTTAAVGKGFAIGSAALTALALLAAYVEEVRIGQVREAQHAVVQVYQDADDSAEAALGRMVYTGYGKIGEKIAAGTKEKAFDCAMILSGPAAKLQTGQVLDYQVLATNEDTNVRTLAVTLPDSKVVHFDVVGAKQASLRQYMTFYEVTLMNPKVLCGMFAGVLLVFLFSALTMKAVGRAAMAMVMEVRRQFKEIPGIMEGTGKPDYARCVAISTAGAQKEMILPSMLALIMPVTVGLLLDVGGVLGLLAGGLTCGFAMAIFMANAGGAWDNAKKYIEKGNFGGKGSANHKATVVGDTVGDPFKDTSGPSLNILIKLMSMVSVVFAGLIVKYAPILADLLHLG
ncbi:MAG: sodium-translocating pyrophosphatase [Sedimentisphaerales bacterium]|nr:sodium-translocating pyrophosphatase [Sedimentisphaerales bacterium]